MNFAKLEQACSDVLLALKVAALLYTQKQGKSFPCRFRIMKLGLLN